MDTRRISARLPADLIEKLEALAAQRGLTLSALIRQLLECGLAPVQQLKHDGGEVCVDAFLQRQCTPSVRDWVQDASARLECKPGMLLQALVHGAIEEQEGVVSPSGSAVDGQ